jgi:antitoxin MazE
MQSSIKKIGNSSGVLIPKPLLSQLGAAAGDTVDLSFDNGRLVIAFEKPHPRAGWAAAAQAIAAAGDDKLVWPEFANADDDELTW